MRKLYYIMALLNVIGTSSYANEPVETRDNTPVEDINRQLVLDAMNAMNPLSPEDISLFRQQEARREEAATRTPVAKIRNESRPLPLEPGKLSQPIILTPGYVGAIVFTDSTGAPWPVARAVLGNSTLFSLVTAAESAEEKKSTGDSHILYVTPLREHANSNILVHLQDSKTPLIVQLVSAPSSTSNREHDGIVNFLVNARGPNAAAPVYDKIMPAVSDVMMNLLDGIPPDDAKLLDIGSSGTFIQAWLKDGKIYARTNFSLLWPAYIAHVESENTHVYEFEYAPAFIFSQNGTPLTIKVNE